MLHFILYFKPSYKKIAPAMTTKLNTIVPVIPSFPAADVAVVVEEAAFSVINDASSFSVVLLVPLPVLL